MGSDTGVQVKDQLQAAWKFCRSLLTRDWEFSDYPVAIREHKGNPSYTGTRLMQHRYVASIVNWCVSGSGNTPGEALQQLEKAFASVKAERALAKRRLPRPGVHVPIEFASQERVSGHPGLADDFVRRVLNLDWAWISDESSLWDFHHEETNDILISKINEVYEVDVSDIQSAKLSEILERIATRQNPG